MRRLLKGVTPLKQKTVGYFKIGNNDLVLLQRGRILCSALDGCDILQFDAPRASDEKVAAVILDLFETTKNKISEAYGNKEALDLPAFAKGLKKLANGKKVSMEPFPQDFTMDTKTSPADGAPEDSIMAPRLRNFIHMIKEMNNLLMVARDDALTLTQGKLIDSMWGAKDMQKVLNEIYRYIVDCKSWERIEFFSGMILKSLERFLHKMQTEVSEVCAEEKRIMYSVLIPNILDNFEEFKKVACRAFMALSELMHIDEQFKKTTSYPAEWFLNGAMLEDLRGDYEKLAKFILSLPLIEKEILYPLEVLKLQFLNESVT